MAFTVETSGGAATEMPNYLVQAQPNVIMNDNANWAEKKGELPAGTVQNWRVASIKVLEIEDYWRDVNVVDFDLEAHLQRFETLRRGGVYLGFDEGVQVAR